MIDGGKEASGKDGAVSAESGGASRSTSSVNTGLRWGANISYAVVLVVLAVIPPTPQVTELAVPDWLAHATAYGIQAGLLFWAFNPLLAHHRALILGVLGASAFGIVTEGLQLLQPGRSVEFKDLVANTLGALLVCAIVAIAGRMGGGVDE